MFFDVMVGVSISNLMVGKVNVEYEMTESFHRLVKVTDIEEMYVAYSSYSGYPIQYINNIPPPILSSHVGMMSIIFSLKDVSII